MKNIENMDFEIVKDLSLEDIVRVPFYENGISCGLPNVAGDDERQYVELPAFTIQNHKDTFVVVARGDSMIGAEILDGDWLLLDASIIPQNGDIVAACVNNEFTLKYYYKDDEDIITLQAANPKYKTRMIMPEDDFRIHGVLYSKWTNFRNDYTNITNLSMEAKRLKLSTAPEEKATPHDFIDCIIDKSDADRLLMRMHELIDGKKGKAAALVVTAAIEEKFITRPTFTQVKSEFPGIGTKQAYSRYINSGAFESSDLESVRARLKI